VTSSQVFINLQLSRWCTVQ